MEKERTLVLIKPDGIVRHLTGKIITRFEDAGLKIIGMKMAWADEKFAGEHYGKDIAERHGERVRNGLIKYIQEGPVIALVLEGVDAIRVVRKIVGSTYPNDALPGTIRGDFAHVSRDYSNSNEINVRNLIHASSDAKDALREIKLWFDKGELHSYKTSHDRICLDE
ncbi:MAG: nucleoside-diphosphate kinase [Nanoarchaeota archaeon]